MALFIVFLPVWILSTNDLIVLGYWKSYLYLFALHIKSSELIFSSHFLLSPVLFLVLLFLKFLGKSISIDSNSWFSFGFKAFKASTCFFPYPAITLFVFQILY